MLKDYYGAISDYTKAIDLNPKYGNAYFNRGVSKAILKDYYGACEDAKKSKILGYSAEKLIELVCN